MTQQNKKNDLGKGIRSLLQNIDTDLKNTAGSLNSDVIEKAAHGQRVPLEKIEPNQNQPRKDFDDTALSELASSIKIHNIIQPLTVTTLPNGKYKIIAGERRYRAAKIAGLKDVPVYIREASNNQLLELALLENLQRENLNAIEIALSYKRMMEDLDYTQEKWPKEWVKKGVRLPIISACLNCPPIYR